jgi:hypothetical protein
MASCHVGQGTHHRTVGERFVRPVVEKRASEFGLDVGEGIEGHLSVRIFEGDGECVGIETAPHMDVSTGEEPCAKPQVIGAVMVASDGDHRHTHPLDHLPKEGVEQAHRLGAGQGPVVEIASEHQHVDPLATKQRDHLFEGVALVVEQGSAVKHFAEMQVGEMGDVHTQPLRIPWNARMGPRCRARRGSSPRQRAMRAVLVLYPYPHAPRSDMITLR